MIKHLKCTAVLLVFIIYSHVAAQKVKPFVHIITAKGLPNVVVASPEEINDILINPGMGFETYKAVNGEQPGYPESSIAYFRWYWDELEPQKEKFNWDMVDSALAAARAAGQRVAIRIMPANGHSGVPEWYRKTGAKGYFYVPEAAQLGNEKSVNWMPDHADPLYARYMGGLVREFAKRYDGHPDIDHMDVGSYGHWGEWHLSFISERERYPFKIKKMIIDWYLDNFKKTPLVIPEDAEDGLIYATKNGTGWRADCMGDYGPSYVADKNGYKQSNNWNLMTRYLQLPEKYPSVGNAWKKSPVAFETCGNIESWVRAGRDIEYIYSVCLKLHTSIFHGTTIPPEWWPATEKFLKRMGYRLVVRLLSHEKWLEPGDTLNVKMTIDNIGVAPLYREYIPTFEIRKANTGGDSRDVLLRHKTNWNVRNWLPGRHNESSSIIIPKDATPDRYYIYFGLLDPVRNNPVIKLAVRGKDSQGWYSWSTLRIVEKDKLKETLNSM